MYNQMNQAQQSMGMGYNPQYQVPVMTNALSPEEIKELRKSSATNVIPQITRAELLASQCTHRDPQKNTFATVPANQEGYVTCTICGKTFRPVEMTEAQAEAVVNDVIDIAQTAKMNFLDMAPGAVAEYFKMLPLLERLPKIYGQSLNNFNKYDSGMSYQNNSNNNFFNMLSAITMPNPGMVQGGYPQQQMYQQYPPQQMYQQYPQQQMYQQYPQQQMYQQQPVPMQQNAFYQQPNAMQSATTIQQQAPNQPQVPNQQAQQQPTVAGKPEVKNVINA